MSYNFNSFQTKIKETNEWLKKELTSMRTGRANLTVLDSIQVELYGSYMPMNQVANISIEDAKTLRISPWDKSAVSAIEKAITNSNLGLSTVADSNGLRLIFPELTGERRQMLIKVAKEKLEEARIALRKAREEVIKDLDNKEKDGEVSEDDKFRHKEEVQKMIDTANKDLETLFENKEKELNQ